MVLKGIGGDGESSIKRQIIPDCGCKIAEGSFTDNYIKIKNRIPE